MEEKPVRIAGLPTRINNVKLKLLIEGLMRSPGSVKSVKRENDGVVCTFQDCKGYQKFLDAKITQVEFGLKVYPITIFKSDFESEAPSHMKSPERHTMSPRSPEPHQNAARRSLGQAHPVQRTQKFTKELQERLYSKKYYWSTLEPIPVVGGTMCLLVQNINPFASTQKIVLHFETKKRSNGGQVAGVINMIDGVLIIFEDAQDCASCMQMTDQEFEKKKLVVFQKKIPEYYGKKFVIEGVGDRTTEDTLTMYLEKCTEAEITPRSCSKQELPGVYLAEYDADFDTSETDTYLQKIESKELEGSQLQAKRLLRTDCLKVGGIPKTVSNDQIQLIFESKRRSTGGPVTRIDRLEKDSALVYFALFEDAERVYEKSNGTVVISQWPVNVALYHHSLARDHENVLQDFEPIPSPKSDAVNLGQKELLQPYEYEPNCGAILMDFLFKRENHFRNLFDIFKSLAVIEVIKSDEEDKPKRLKFTASRTLHEKSQKEFETMCKTSFEKFMAQFSKSSRKFDSSKLERSRSHNLFPELKVTYTGNGRNKDVEVSWKQDEPIVEVMGVKEKVDRMMQHIANCANSTVVRRRFEENQYGVLIHCDIISDLEAKFKNLQMKCDANECSITFIGQDTDISGAQIDALSAVTIDRKKFTGLNQIVLKFLSDSMQKSGKITSVIHDTLKQYSVKAFVFLDDDEPFVKAKTREDFKMAVDVLRQCIIVDVIKMDEAMSMVMKSPEWKAFQQSLCVCELCEIYAEGDDCVTLVGIQSETKVIHGKIKSFFDENAVQRFFVNAQYGKARFVVEKSREFSTEMCRRKEIKCGITPEDNGGVFVEGKRESLEIAKPVMRRLLGSIIEETLTLEKPGLKEYYSSKSWKQFQADVMRFNDCIILTETRDNPEWVKYNRDRSFESPSKSFSQTRQSLQEEKLLSVTLPKSAVTLSVWMTDIAKHKCDVIVNASNEDLKLLSTGVSGVIKEYDRKNSNKIQREMDAYSRRNYGNMLPGECVMTTSGNLPGCTVIAHVCGPRWNSPSMYSSNPRLTLKACISRSLENMEGDQMRSIAIPAVSCGAFGGKVSVCVPLIVEAVEEYFQGKTNSCISEVHFVENSKLDVLNEFVSCLKKYEQDTGDTPVTKKTPVKISSSPARSTGGVKPLQQGSCVVVLVHGDISEQKADVIVNVADPKNLRNMLNGPVISQVLGRKAGHKVQQEVRNISDSLNVGDVHETSGGHLACKKLYHALVTHYNEGQAQYSESVIRNVVSISLGMADKSGFKSIVFPAIATGGYKYPADIIAKLMRQEIVNFSGDSLREVVILLHPQNRTAIQAFDDEFNSSSSQNTPSHAPAARNFIPSYSKSSLLSEERQLVPDPKKERLDKKSSTNDFERIDDSSVAFGGLVASIQQGDITEQECDVIVNSTNTSFCLSQGMVSKQILRKGGQIIQREAESGSKKRRDSDFVVTSGGKLHCRNIIHLVVPVDLRDLQKKIIKVLKEVERLQMRHVCMPAFGTGNLGLADDEVGSIMQASIDQFVKSQRQPKHLETVTIIIFENLKLEKFKKGFFAPKKGFLERMVEWGGEIFGYGSSPNTDGKEWDNLPQISTSICLFFYSTSEIAIQQAKSVIGSEIQKVVHRAVIANDAINRISDWEVHDICKAGKRHNVHIQQSQIRYLEQLIIEGQTKDVMRAQDEIKDVLKEFEEAETCATYVLWQKKTASGEWEDYQLRSSQILEKAYKERTSGQSSYATSFITVPEFIDEKVTEQTVDLSLLDGKFSQVRRKIRERSIADIPSFWDDMKGQQYVVIPLVQTSEEYKKVLNKFQTTNNPFCQSIISIERIQNESLYKQYVAKKAEIAEKLKNHGGQIERDLFQGTAEDNKIIQDGFDRSWWRQQADSNPAMYNYGKGVYFHTDPSVSHNNATPDAQGQRKMFLANVVVGEFCIGNQATSVPPIKTGSSVKNDIFDSTVDDDNNPTVFVIYKDASAYPAYRITYT